MSDPPFESPSADATIDLRAALAALQRREAQLSEHEAWLQAIIAQSGDGIIVADEHGVVQVFNLEAERQHGVSRREVTAEAWAETYGLVTLDGRPLPVAETPLYRAVQGERVLDAQWRVRRPDGETRTLSGTAVPLRRSDGTAAGAVLITHDHTERDLLLAEARAARSAAEFERARLRDLFMQAPLPIAVTAGPEHVFTLINPGYQILLGRGRELRGKPIREALPEIAGQGFFELLDRVFATGEPYYGTEVPARLDRRGDGALETAFYNFVYAPYRGDDGRIVGITACAIDVTAQVEARLASERESARLSTIFATLDEGITLHDESGAVVFGNQSAERLLGLSVEHLTGQSSADPRWGAVRPDGSPYPGVERPLVRALRSGRSVSGDVMGIRHTDGRLVWLSVNARPHFAADGRTVAGVVTSFFDVTERREDEHTREVLGAALRASEARLRAALDATGLGTWELDVASGTLRWDDHSRALFGLPPGAPVDYATAMALIHPEDRERVELALRRTFEPARGGRFDTEFRLADAGGERGRWIATRGQALFDSEGGSVRVIGTNLDITARKRAEAVQTRAARYATLRADVGTALAAGDSVRTVARACAEAVVRYLDLAFARIWTLDEATQVLELRASAGLYTHVDGPHGHVPVGHLKIGLVAQERTPYATNDVAHDPRVGDKAWAAREGMVAFVGFPLQVGPRLIGVIAAFARRALADDEVAALGAIADAVALGVERRWTEDERQLLLASEQRARAAAEEANELKDQFLATVSHELRTPLNAMLGWTRMLRSGSVPVEKRAHGLATIERNALAQAQLIEDLLDVSRILSGKLRLDVAPVDLAAVVLAALDVVRPAAEAKALRLQPTLDPRAGPIVGDAARLQQVVWNLLSNAVKFTSKGGRIQVRLERVDSSIELVVTDTGQGIDEAFLPHVFDRFRQADGTTTRAHGGLGLGLSIVRQLVELHGGTIRALSQGVGLGATFVVRLPLAALQTTEIARRLSHPTLGALPEMECPPGVEGLRVLAVDDEPDARDLLVAVLESCGAVVTTAGSVPEALAAFAKHRPDMVLSDVGMPDADGYALISALRALPDEAGGRTPVVALTAYARPEDRKRALRAGFNMHIAKPIDPAELLDVVASLARQFPRR
jgi:PAS domain S-box-containing protein